MSNFSSDELKHSEKETSHTVSLKRRLRIKELVAIALKHNINDASILSAVARGKWHYSRKWSRWYAEEAIRQVNWKE